jgi:ABC-2 type transport system permease protein
MSVPAGGARIVDRGYRHYEGKRLGPGHAFWVMLRAGLTRGMGIRRPFRTKILPWLLLLVANAPSIISLAAYKVNPLTADLPPAYPELLSNGAFQILLLLFVAVTAPDLLCPDRRERVLSLYFAAPITRAQYALARVGSVTTLLLGLGLLPGLVLFFGNALLANSFVGYIQNHAHDLAHVLLAGVLVPLYYGSLACAVASFTDRRAVAVGSLIGLLLVTGFAGSVIGEGLTFPNHDWFVLLDLIELPARVVRWLFGETPIAPSRDATPVILDGWAYLIALIVLIGAGLATLLRRYQRMES